MKILNSIIDFFNTLSIVDIVFFLAVLILMILVVTLIYFIRINEDVKDLIKKDKLLEETAEMKIVKEIENNMGKDEPIISITEYEREQEDKAIISYDELVNKSSNYDLNYESEELKDDLSVKKVNLDDLLNKNAEIKENYSARVISYAKEEAFLEALKRLQKELGNRL